MKAPSIFALALVLGSSQAWADASRCQQTVAKGAALYARALVKAMQLCPDRLLHGSLDPCPDVKAAAAAARADARLQSPIARDCGGPDATCGTADDEPLAAIGWDGGRCPNHESGASPQCLDAVAHCGDIASCLVCVGTKAVDRTLALYYDDVLPAPPGSELARCQAAIGKAAAAPWWASAPSRTSATTACVCPQ